MDETMRVVVDAPGLHRWVGGTPGAETARLRSGNDFEIHLVGVLFGCAADQHIQSSCAGLLKKET